MKYLDFYHYFRNFPIFSYQEIKKVYPSVWQDQLLDWQEKGYLKRVVRGWYCLGDFQDKFTLNEKLLYFIANKIYKPSYISLEMALSWYNIIPEGVYLITSVTSKTTADFDSSFGKFNYQKIQSKLMFGYQVEVFEKYTYKIASLEKTILDYLYLNPKIDNILDFEGLRWNILELQEKLNREKLLEYLEVFDQKRLSSRVKIFLKYIKHI